MVKIFLDSKLIGKKPYTSLYNDESELFTTYTVGYGQLPSGLMDTPQSLYNKSMSDGMTLHPFPYMSAKE